MKNIITTILLLAAFSVGAQNQKENTTEVFKYNGRNINGVPATIWDSGYMGNIYISKDSIYIKAKNDKANSWKYSIVKSKTSEVGKGKRGKRITTYVVESETVTDDDLYIKITLIIQNKATLFRPNTLQVVVRDTFTESNHIVDYFITKRVR
tara:strand:- start:557 stop:1012 length:456 start_codon:yes stop_codon:yes gene_type:complete